jgi:N6-L-threonylcarbamoyladenine synthase
MMTVIIGIEATAHTFGVGVIKEGKIKSNVRDLFTTLKGGLIPMEVREHHKKVSDEVYKKALREAKIKENEIDAIAFSNAPGLAPCLIEGMNFAKRKALELNVKIIPVNHCIAHLEIGEIFGAKDPVMLYASGANTQIIAYEAKKFRVFGETLDLGVGNFIDGFARFAGLGFPGGPKIEDLAKNGDKYIEIPYVVKGMDVSFSGIQTKLKSLLEKGEKIEDLSFSMQENVFAMLIEAAERAISHTGKKELLLAGGVACNKRLQEMAKIMCSERKIRYFCPDNSLLVDNGAMIGYLGWKMYNCGCFYESIDLDKVDISPRERTDDVEVVFRKDYK